MPPPLLIDPSTISTMPIIADKEAIRRANPQRFEMEHLDGIVMLDPSKQVLVGFKEVRETEFWVRGHMPGYPLLPGVLMCEAAAQLSSYYCAATNQTNGDFVGFGGMEEVRFRQPVKVGQRLYLVGKALKLTRRQVVFNVQGFVENTLVFHGNIIGIALMRTDNQQSATANPEG